MEWNISFFTIKVAVIEKIKKKRNKIIILRTTILECEECITVSGLYALRFQKVFSKYELVIICQI